MHSCSEEFLQLYAYNWYSCVGYCFLSSLLFIAIEIGFTQRRINHTEEFRQYDTLINKSRVSEQTFFIQVELSTLNSPFGQSATRGSDEDFEISGSATQGEDFNIPATDQSTVLIRLEPSEANRLFDYFIYEDNTPENQEVFQLSITPAIGSPTLTCTEANGCFQQLEIVIVDNDGKFLDFLFCISLF